MLLPLTERDTLFSLWIPTGDDPTPHWEAETFRAAIRACASECARIADDFVPQTRPLTSEEDVAQRVCRIYAKVIRARFGLDTAAKEGM